MNELTKTIDLPVQIHKETKHKKQRKYKLSTLAKKNPNFQLSVYN